MSEELSAEFNPAKFALGMPDKAGRSSAKSVHGCLLSVAWGSVSLRNALIDGHPWMNEDATRIEIPIQGRVRTAEGWQPHGSHLVVVTGRNLKGIFVNLNDDKQPRLAPNSDEEGGHVDSIEVVAEDED